MRRTKGFSSSSLRKYRPSRSVQVQHKQQIGEISNTLLHMSTPANYENGPQKRKVSLQAVGYGSLSLAYSAQIMMEFAKSGLSTLFHSAVGGPAVAGVLSMILCSGEIGKHKNDISSKLMNGTLMIYSSLCMLLVSLAPQFQTAFGMLFSLSALFTFLINAKGFLKGFEGINILLPRIHKANMYAIPRDLPNLFYYVAMISVILLKADAIIPLFADFYANGIFPRTIAHNVSIIAELSILGGSLVTLRDAANEKILGTGRFRWLNLIISYVFGFMAASTISRGNSLFSTVKGFLLLVSASGCLRNSTI
jgi:hypothetical protein